jgi:hypothetical protein
MHEGKGRKKALVDLSVCRKDMSDNIVCMIPGILYLSDAQHTTTLAGKWFGALGVLECHFCRNGYVSVLSSSDIPKSGYLKKATLDRGNGYHHLRYISSLIISEFGSRRVVYLAVTVETYTRGTKSSIIRFKQ